MIEVRVVDKTHIRHILVSGGVLGIARDESQEHIVSEYWRRNPFDSFCNSSKSRDPAERPNHHAINETIDHLWRNRGCLWI